MKNTLLALISIVLFSLNSNAQGKEIDKKFEFIYGSLITTLSKETIEYKFKSLEELNNGLDEIINEFNFESPKEKTCEIKIEIKIELSSGMTKILISEVISTGCDNELLSAAVNRFKSIALETRS